MSPIGRVFIVLNLIAAGAFVMFAGSHVQTQHNWKAKFTAKEKELADKTSTWDAERVGLEKDRNNFENAKTAAETQLGEVQVRLQQKEDEVKRQQQMIAAQTADLSQIRATNEQMSVAVNAAFNQAKSAYESSIADQKTRDDAVRAKDSAEAENRGLKAQIASLQGDVQNREGSIADLSKEVSRLKLLTAVAQQKGFLPSMAAPTLAGMVTNASGRLCTIQVTDNPGKVDIAEEIARNPFRIAIWDASGYKGEAVATHYEASANAILCNLELVKAEIKQGDKASTKTP